MNTIWCRRPLWVLLLFATLLYPSHSLSALDGAPLDRPFEAIAVGIVVPALVFLAPSFVDTMLARGLIVALLLLKLAGTALLAQGGWCASFRLDEPLHGTIPPALAAAAQAIPIDEPFGVLHSWDVRADWRDPSSSCTAVVTRVYRSQREFPSWFLNLLRHVEPARDDVSMTITGFINPDAPGTVTFATGSGVLRGTVGGKAIAVGPGEARVDVASGAQEVRLTMVMPAGDRWMFVPRWNQQDLWSQVPTITVKPSAIDEVAWRTRGWIELAIGLALVGGWLRSLWTELQPGLASLAWMVTASAAMAALAALEGAGRFSGLLLMAAVAVPMPPRLRNLRGAFLLAGVPWLSFFCAKAFGQIGAVTFYSGDDWLTYQAAGHRIFMAGYWLEGGNAVFNYQPLYRWMAGALHLAFGDSSVGEVYWDAACLLAGALLSFALVDVVAGFPWGMAATGATLATFTTGTTWYLVGRGLSEVAAAGWAFLAAFCLLRARRGHVAAAVAAGAFATLMFYTRLNHLLFGVALGAMLLPAGVTSWREAAVAWVTRMRARVPAAYALTFGVGLALFTLRTWWYAGTFNPLYGTSLSINDTGLRPWTLASMGTWERVLHSVFTLLLMNEPPRPDVRALFVLAGVAAAALSVLRVPLFKRVPLGLSVTCLGGIAGALVAHTHNYPGRMSIHLVPFAVATLLCAVASGMDRLRARSLLGKANVC
ncbi:MAG: hypothetical protein DMF94_33390 [Acidobacteria bacterium]|nr:MAG: hypothetical protein DMF94_33390 [Acidobacteriota bacterium]